MEKEGRKGGKEREERTEKWRKGKTEKEGDKAQMKGEANRTRLFLNGLNRGMQMISLHKKETTKAEFYPLVAVYHQLLPLYQLFQLASIN